MQKMSVSRSLPSLAAVGTGDTRKSSGLTSPATTSVLSPGPNGSSTTSATSVTSFLPKLLLKVANLDERLQILAQQKVDTQVFEQFRLAVTASSSGPNDELRTLKASMEKAQARLDVLHDSLKAKADEAALGRLRDVHHTLERSVRSKAEAEQLRAFQELGLRPLEKSLEHLQAQVSAKAPAGAVHEQGTHLTALKAAMRKKADTEVAASLQDRATSLEAALEALQTVLRQKADASLVQETRRQLQDLSTSVRSKADTEQVRLLKAGAAKHDAALGELRAVTENKAERQPMEQLGADVQMLSNVLRRKVDKDDAQKLQEAAIAAKTDLERQAQRVENSRRHQQEIDVKVSTLQYQILQTREMSQQLSSSKADASSVPHLDPELLAFLDD